MGNPLSQNYLKRSGCNGIFVKQNKNNKRVLSFIIIIIIIIWSDINCTKLQSLLPYNEFSSNSNYTGWTKSEAHPLLKGNDCECNQIRDKGNMNSSMTTKY